MIGQPAGHEARSWLTAEHLAVGPLPGRHRKPLPGGGFYVLAALWIGLAGWLAGADIVALIGLVAFAAHLGWQVRRLDIADPALCLSVFKSNRDAGLVLFGALLVDQFIGRTA